MIEAIKRIGEYAIKGNLTRDAFLDGICQKLNDKITRIKKNGEKEEIKQHVVFLNFNTNAKKIETNIEAVKENSGQKYFWFGNPQGNKPQINVTSNKLDNILTKTLPTIKDDLNGQLKKDIKTVLHDFFDVKKVEKKKIECHIKPETFEFFGEKNEDVKNEVKRIVTALNSIATENGIDHIVKQLKGIWKDINGEILKIDDKGDISQIKRKIKELCNELLNNSDAKLKKKYENLKKLTEGLLENEDLKPNEVSIYTIKINNHLICRMPEYRHVVYNEKIGKLFVNSGNYKKNFQSDGRCMICHKKGKPTTSNTTNLEFKFYMTDKVGFSSNLDGRFKRNYNICKDCYQYLIIGERFTLDNTATRIGSLNTLIIPSFIFKAVGLDIKKFSDFIKSSTTSVVKLKSLEKFQKELEKFRKFEDKKNSFILNYLFYHSPPSSSEFKVLKLIKDVPPSRLDFIREKEEKIKNLVDEKYNKNGALMIDLNSIYYSMSVNKSSVTHKKYLDIIDAIFSNRKIDYNFLINQFTKVIRIIKFEREGYNIWTGEHFTNKILQLNFILLFFKKLGILKGVDMPEEVNKSMDEITDITPKDILDYWKDVELYENNKKKALFLLGHLIGEIGMTQDTKGIKKKPILNKINFQGMGVEKLIRLSNDVFEKLRQHDILQYNENLFSAFKMLFDKDTSKWGLSDQENVFYVLSGYAFSNYLMGKKSKEKYFEELKKKSECVEKAKGDGKNTEEGEMVLEEAKRLAEKGQYSKAKKLLNDIKITNNEGG